MTMSRLRSPDSIFFGLVLIAYIAGQVFIGSYLPGDGTFHYDAPAFLLYFLTAVAAMEIFRRPGRGRILMTSLAAVFFVGIVIDAVDRY
ncbi:MAG: hypothetical protein PHR28_14925, partial [candidate division Zixibacteria bacterium]|nr:hypothetical protein [candidate division Zixibacteria bacterium]